MDVQWLASKVGAKIIDEARAYSDALIGAEKLRKAFPDSPPEHISQAITQASLQHTLAQRWSIDTSSWLLTSDGISQATRPQAARYRANFIQQQFGKNARVLDLTCGLGFDSYFMAEAGLRVQSIELDSTTAMCARHNLTRFGIEVLNADATLINLPEVDVIFIDPARRNPAAARTVDGMAQRLLNPNDWSPSWNFITRLSEQRNVVAKIAPGIADEVVVGWDVQWLSVGGDVVEATAVHKPSEVGTKRQAVLIDPMTAQNEVFEGQTNAPVSDKLGNYLLSPDGAITRAGALDMLCRMANGGLVNEHIGWVTTNDRQAIHQIQQFSPKTTDCFEIIGTSKFDSKAIARAIKDLPASAITIMTRGVSVDVDLLRKKISPGLDRTARELVIAIYRDDSGNVALICRRLK